VNFPEDKYSPIDDGNEWNEAALRDWLDSINEDGIKVVKILAKKKLIDPRAEAENLGWPGPRWAGVWTGPRRQAGYVIKTRKISSWPYGHTYYEPRRMWMHQIIAERILIILGVED
jgi:hypothetical protein